MQQHWLKKSGNDRLIVYVLGWASDYHAVEHIAPGGYDVLCIYDLRSLAPISLEKLGNYRKTYLFAWSFGVWAAEQIFAGESFTRAVALNGTPFPVDPIVGIDPRRMEVTLRGIRSRGAEDFNRRAYGRSFDMLADFLPPRPLAEIVAELTELKSLAVKPYSLSIKWDKAVVGSGDLIFTPANMLAYWKATAVVVPLQHYPFGDEKTVTGELGNR